MERLQDQAQCVLHDYVVRKFDPSIPMASKDESHFGKLLLMLPILRKIKTTTIEQVFFHDIIGQLTICDIIREIYRQ